MNEQPPSISVRKIGATVLVSNEVLNPKQPTDEQRREWRAREVAEWVTYDAALPALAALDNPTERALLDLHAPVTSGDTFLDAPHCEGCDMDGYEAEYPSWPCRTVAVIAAAHGITLPANLFRRPIEGPNPEPLGPTGFSRYLEAALGAMVTPTRFFEWPEA